MMMIIAVPIGFILVIVAVIAIAVDWLGVYFTKRFLQQPNVQEQYDEPFEITLTDKPKNGMPIIGDDGELLEPDESIPPQEYLDHMETKIPPPIVPDDPPGYFTVWR